MMFSYAMPLGTTGIGRKAYREMATMAKTLSAIWCHWPWGG
jgi:hypothetical protein